MSFPFFSQYCGSCICEYKYFFSLYYQKIKKWITAIIDHCIFNNITLARYLRLCARLGEDMNINNLLFKEKVPLLNSALDAYAKRMTVSAKNVANVNTVGYKPEKVKFEELFNEQVVALQGNKTEDRHIPIGFNPNPKGEVTDIEVPASEIMQSGDNDFNLDKEMATIAETQIRFQFASQSLQKHFKQLGAAITGNSNF